jgi:iron complex transport system ATP-binding protein
LKLSVVEGSFGYNEKNKILKNISFSLDDGKFLCVLGQNGVGKTTFLKCLTGILKWDSGYVTWNEDKIDGISNLKEVAYVPQAHSVSFPFTALDMVCMGRTKHMGFFSMPSKNDKKVAMNCLNEMGIESLANRKCSAMSGGQLQMVYIARALAAEPKLLILDEPESHLDFKNQELIITKLKYLVKEKNISCIMNTHSPEHALRISDYILLFGKNGTYKFGETNDVLTENNINDFFEVKTKLLNLEPLGVKSKTFVLIN